MRSNSILTNQLQAHNGWLNGISIIFGYLWIISGIDKIGSGIFVSGFHSFVLDNYFGPDTYVWYSSLVRSVILPYGTFFAYAVEWGEVFIGLALILGALWLLFRDSAVAHFILLWANVGAAFLVLNIMLAEGAFFFGIDTSIIYDEGISFDAVVLLVSILMVAANSVAFLKEWKTR